MIDCAATIQEHLALNRDEEAQELLDALVAAGVDRSTIAEHTDQLSAAWNRAGSPDAMWEVVETSYLADGRERGYAGTTGGEAPSLYELRQHEADFYGTTTNWPL